MLVIFKRGDDVRVLRGIEKVEEREVPGLGPAVLFWHERGDGQAFSCGYMNTYDEVIAIGGSEKVDCCKLQWVKGRVLTGLMPETEVIG